MRREHHRIYERFLWIDTEIRRNAYPNSRTIADHFEISPKTAQRSIDFMRDRFELPLEYSAENRGWYYSEHAFALPAEMLGKWAYDPDASKEAVKHDRSSIYGGFHVYTLKNGPARA